MNLWCAYANKGVLTLVAEMLQSYATVCRGAFLPAKDSRTYSHITLGFWSGLQDSKIIENKLTSQLHL